MVMLMVMLGRLALARELVFPLRISVEVVGLNIFFPLPAIEYLACRWLPIRRSPFVVREVSRAKSRLRLPRLRLPRRATAPSAPSLSCPAQREVLSIMERSAPALLPRRSPTMTSTYPSAAIRMTGSPLSTHSSSSSAWRASHSRPAPAPDC